MPASESASRRAARYAAEHAVTFDAAAQAIAELDGTRPVTRASVSLAWRRLFGVPAAPRGRPPTAHPRVHEIDLGSCKLRASDEEIAAYRRAAGGLPLATWLRGIVGPRRRKATRLRALARKAAGLSEE